MTSAPEELDREEFGRVVDMVGPSDAEGFGEVRGVADRHNLITNNSIKSNVVKEEADMILLLHCAFCLIFGVQVGRGMFEEGCFEAIVDRVQSVDDKVNLQVPQ